MSFETGFGTSFCNKPVDMSFESELCQICRQQTIARVGYVERIYDQTVVGMDYLDCCNQALTRIEFKVNYACGHVVSIQCNHWPFPIVVSVREE